MPGAPIGDLGALGSGAQDSYYNLLVQGFRDGHLNVKRDVPPGLVTWRDDPSGWLDAHGLDDLSYYKGKLYLYFGVTPAVVLLLALCGADRPLPVSQGRGGDVLLGGFSGQRGFAVRGVAALLHGNERRGGGGRGAGAGPGEFRAGDIGAVGCL